MKKAQQRNDKRRATRCTKMQFSRLQYRIWGHSAHGLTRMANIESKKLLDL
jgi:hypothetical protein